MRRKLLLKLGEYLGEKRNFIKVGAISFGVLSAIGLLWMLGRHGSIGWWLFLVVVAFLTGWAWAYFMWLAFENDFRRISNASAAAQAELLKDSEGTS